MSKLVPANLGQFGIGRRDRMGTRSDHPLRVLAERVGSVVGAPDFDIYIFEAGDGDGQVATTNPASLLIPSWATARPQPQLVYLLAKHLTFLATGMPTVGTMSAGEIGTLLGAAAYSISPTFSPPGVPPEELETRAKQIQKAIPRKARRAVEEAGARYAAAPSANLERWIEAVRRTVARAALLLADDLSAAVEIHSRTGGSNLDPLVKDLLHFWVSDAAVRYRRATPAGT
jgi:hypothetical protein